ncbi:DUF5915 domain-containing protein [Sporosarcina siberiensis]|uniref:DUF5915 domain-containing protein n=1 Tax=Sporosarcina siberiensis TaxID=1365606 RepID=A0ABW4SFN3_9BACL
MQEGMARDLIRAIQAHRKELNLPMNMCIDIGVATDEALHVVVEKSEIKIGEHTALFHLMPINY